MQNLYTNKKDHGGIRESGTTIMSWICMGIREAVKYQMTIRGVSNNVK